MSRAISRREKEFMFRLSRVTMPSVGFKIPSNDFKSVVLPDPFGPTRARSSPLVTMKDIALSTIRFSNPKLKRSTDSSGRSSPWFGVEVAIRVHLYARGSIRAGPRGFHSGCPPQQVHENRCPDEGRYYTNMYFLRSQDRPGDQVGEQ